MNTQYKDMKLLTIVASCLNSASISVFEPTKGTQSGALHRTSYTGAGGVYSTCKPFHHCPILSL